MTKSYFLLLTLLVGSALCAPKSLIYSNDGNLDDLMVLAPLLKSGSFNVLGMAISTTGFSTGVPGANNFLRYLELMGSPHNDIPIAVGAPYSLSGQGNIDKAFTIPARWLRPFVDILWGNAPYLPLTNKTIDPRPAKVFMRDIILEEAAQGRNVTIFCTGTATDIAELLRDYPEVKQYLDGIVLEGGAVYVPGNLFTYLENTAANFNVFPDPIAWDMVLRSGVPVTMVPSDATNYVPFTMQYFNRLSNLRTPEGRFVYNILVGVRAYFGDDVFFAPDEAGYHLWDPICEFVFRRGRRGGDSQVLPLSVNLDESSNESGRTYVDYQNGAPVTVYLTAKTNLFENDFYSFYARN